MSIQVELDLIAKKLKLDLKENEIPCPTCHGVRLIEKKKGDFLYMESCPDCYDGKHRVCEFCGKTTKFVVCDCEGSVKYRKELQDERESEFQARKDRLAFERREEATLMSFNELVLDDRFTGLYIGDKYCDKNDLGYIKETIYEILSEGGVIECFAFVAKTISMELDVADYVKDQASEFVEDGDDYVWEDEHYKSGIEQLNQWIKSLNIGYYDEDLDYTVDLTNIYLEVKADVER